MILVPNSNESQAIKPIINRAYMFVYTSVARDVPLQKLEQEPYNPSKSYT